VAITDEDVVFVAGYLGHDRSPFHVLAWVVMNNQAFTPPGIVGTYSSKSLFVNTTPLP
jgi:hypothetical protein